MALDLVVWDRLRRGRIPLLARIGIDALDVALWAPAADSNLQDSLAAQIPVEVEAGMEWGPAAVAVPALHAAVSTMARHRTGARRDAAAHLPHLGAIVAGMATRWMEQRRLGRARQQHQAELSAKRVRAFLAGQSSVAMGASSIVDRLAPIAMAVGTTGGETALAQVRAGWKSDLADQSRRYALYLDQAIRLWEHHHNDHPDLREFAVATVAEGDGTELLTGPQSQALIEQLEERNLRGPVRVELSERRSTSDRRPGRRLGLLVNGTPLDVPADPGVRIVEFDPGPPVMLFAAWAALMPTAQRDGAVPAKVTAFCAGTWLLGAWDALRRSSDDNAGRELAVGVSLAALQGALYSRTARQPTRADGTQLYHGTYGVAPLLLLLLGNVHRATARQRAVTIASVVGVAAAAYRLASRPRSLADFAGALAWPTAVAIASPGTHAATEREAALLMATLEAEDEKEERAAYDEGQSTVLALVRAAITEAETAVRDAQLNGPERAAFQHRLAEIRQLAAEFDAGAPVHPTSP